MNHDPWIVFAGYLQSLAMGGLPTLNQARRETIKDATAADARLCFDSSARARARSRSN